MKDKENVDNEYEGKRWIEDEDASKCLTYAVV